MSQVITGRNGWKPSRQLIMESQGVQLCRSRRANLCQICQVHKSRYRRKCPICNGLVAPGCWPVQCWSDELNHCRICHSIIGILKLHCFRMEQPRANTDESIQIHQPNVISYLDFPMGVQFKIMMYIFQITDFIR